jgi:predicted transposase YbfD/YdcC
VLLSSLDRWEAGEEPSEWVPLVGVLSEVGDPRGRQGRRYRLAPVLALMACAVAAGQRSVLAIMDWASAHAAALDGPGQAMPSYDTLRRHLAAVDPDELDAAMGRWASQQDWRGGHEGRRAIAADGKEVRGAKNGGGTQTRLMSAVTHDTAVVVGQVGVGPKTNEIPKAAELFDQIGDISGAVVTLDALHTQERTAEMIVARGADYVFTVKANQPGLLASCLSLPWERATPCVTREKAHGRVMAREARACPPTELVCFPHVAQVARITRANHTAGTTETCHVITSVPPGQADAAQIAAWVRGHWAIENKLHWVRDWVYDEDRSQLRRGNAPRVMATLRNTALNLLRLHGVTRVAQTQRHLAAHPEITARLIGISPTQPLMFSC